MKNKKIKELLEFGILNIDKPSGPTSFDVSDFVRKKLGLRKTSHFGTLDPKVTGVLPIALNRACKLTGFFLGHDKTYVGIMRFHEEISKKKVEDMIKKKFLGKIKQTPPVKSRVKREEREREVYEFEILEVEGKDSLFRAKVEGGTYIRKLIDDLGKELGVGAHMLELRRIKAGIFCEDDENFINLYDLEKISDGITKKMGRVDLVDNSHLVGGRGMEAESKSANEELKKIIIPAEEALKKIYPVVEVKESEVKRLWTGKPVLEKDLVKKEKFEKDKIINIFAGKKFIGIYKILNGKDVFAKAEFVLQPIK